MKRCFTFVFAVILFTQNVFAETEIDPTDISFESNRKFISTLSNVLEQDFDAAEVKKGLKPFNDRSVGYRAESFDTLIEKLPLASNDLIQSAMRLGILTDPKLLVKLQEEIYFSAVGTISPEAAQSARASYRTPALAAVALMGGVAGGGGGGGSGPANPQVSISVASASFSENGGSTDVTLTLDRAIEADLEVTLSFTSDATDGTDYTTDATATISAGDTTTSFTVAAVDDSVFEGNETGIITIASVDQAGVDISSTNSVTITILEDETVPTVSLAASAASVSEESGSGITFTASIDQVASVDLTITLSVSFNSRSAAPASYVPSVPSSIDIVIPAGQLSGTTTFVPTNNDSYDGTSDLTFSVSSIGGGGAIGNTIPVPPSNVSEDIRIIESEVPPTVTLTADRLTTSEGGSAITFTATLSGSTYEDVVVSFAGTGTATQDLDYTLNPVTISAGSTAATSIFNAIADDLYDATSDETAVISISAVSGGSATESGNQSETITITDGDSAPTVTLAVSDATVAEDGGTSTITATLSVATYADVAIGLDTAGVAVEGTDYGAVSDITVSAGSTSGTSVFTSTDDSVYEGDEAATISIASVSGGSATAAGSNTSASITVDEDETAPTVNLSSSATSLEEDGAAITITATLSGVADEDVTVPLNTSGTATEGTDYATISDITISAGATTDTANLTPTDDGLSEGPETIVVSLGTLSGADATAGSTSSLSLTLEDDDVPLITLTTSANSIAENSGSSLTLTATASLPATEDIVVSLAASGTATSGTDYAALPSTITIPANQTTITTSFTPTDDDLYDAANNETAVISISGVSGGFAREDGDQSVTLTITDNESAPTVTLAVSDATVAEDGGTSTITATLSGKTYADVTVNLSAAGTAVDDTDYTYGGSITIAQGTLSGTDTLTSTADDLYDAASDETAVISISAVSGGSATESGNQSETITITDGDSAPTVTLAVSDATVAEDGGTSTITATLSGKTYEDVTVSLSAAGTAVDDTDYAYGGSITIAQGALSGTDTLTSTADDLYDAASNETAIISVTSVSGGGATESGTQSETITITDAESAPTVTLAVSDATVAEDGGTSTITATLSGKTYEDVTVSLSAAGTAVDDTDYAYGGSITIAQGALSGTDTLTSTADDLYDAASNETAIISVTSVSGGGATESGTQSETITITDAESAPTVTLAVSDATVAEDGGTSTITATLSGKTYEDVTVSLSAAGTALDDTDYTYGGTITIAQGTLYDTDTLTSTADDLYDAATDETAIITISSVSGGGATKGTTVSKTITITDAESAPTVTLEVSSNTIAENSSNSIDVKARLSHASYEAITLSLTSTGADSTVVADTDYQAPSSITVAANSVLSSASAFTALDDVSNPVYEENELVTLTISGVTSGSAGLGGTVSQAITITENESAPVLSLSGTTSIDERSQTATITASISIKVDKTLTISFSKSGTATDVTDYSISGFSISAGSTSNESDLEPVSDTDYESGSETVVLTASAAGISGISNSNSVTVTITNEALNSGTQFSYNSGLATTFTGYSEYNWMHSGSNNTNSINSSYNLMNLNMALGYEVYGTGLRAAVVDAGFWLTEAGYSRDHLEFDNKSIDSFGSFNAAGTDCGDSHGTCVLGVIGAEFDGVGMMGIAPGVSFHVTDWQNTTGFSGFYDKLAAATIDATSSTTVVQNNSWGYTTLDANQFQAELDIHGYDEATVLARWDALTGGGLSSITDYKNALNSFQENGVIVFANQNDPNEPSAHFLAAMPVWLTELEEAWITVANIDVTGSEGSRTYTNKGNPCGLAAKFCMAADGHMLLLPTHQSGNLGYYGWTSGTSFSAPMVSGAVVLMAAHFPNQTPEQWVDRLLASADNDIGFTHIGYVEFGNGVKHSYSAEAGHGMLDIYAALQPILTSSYTPQVAAAMGVNGSSKYNISDTRIATAASFGDALSRALQGEVTYMYDALDGGFAIDAEQFAVPQLVAIRPTINLSSELGRTVLSNRLKKSILDRPRDSSEKNGFFEASVQQSNKTLQQHTAMGNWNGFNDVQYMFPFLSSIQSGDGLSFGDDIGNDYISFSWNKQHAKFSDGEGKEALTVSYSTALGTATDLQFIGGVADENEYFLGTKGSGAFDFTGADNITSFFGVKSTTPIGDDLIISAGLALSYTDVNKPASGIITEISGVTASAFEIGVTAFNVIGNDALSLSIGQPHRVESGSAHMKIAGLENQDGTVPFVEKTASLAPSGRQIDLAMAYNFDLDQTSAIRFKMMQTLEKGHVKDADPEASLYLGYATEEVFGEDSLAFGAAFIDDRDPSLELKYSIRW